MSNYEQSPIEKEIQKMSEERNPYAEQCPNRHLWSEGFRIGAKMKSEDFKGNEILMSQKIWDVVKLFEQNGMKKAAKILRDNI